MVTGLVTKLHEKTKNAANKPLRSSAWSILLDDSVWYNFGFDKPQCDEGDVISFESKEGQWGNEGIASSVSIVDKSAPKAKKAVQSNDARQESIVYQSSLKAAIDIVRIGFEQDCLSLPSKKADKLDVLVATVHEVAQGIALKAISPDFSSFGKEEQPASDDE